MQVKKLTLTNVRAFKGAEFEFQPGMNLLVGVNGAGKSTVLDVLRRMYARWLTGSIKEKDGAAWNRDDDITVGQPFMAITAELDFYGQAFTYTAQLQRDTVALNPDAGVGQVRETAYDVQDIDELRDSENRVVSGFKLDTSSQPLVVFFSPHRAVIETGRKTARTSMERANVLALQSRGMNIQDLAQWWLVQETLGKETRGQIALLGLTPADLLKTLNIALHNFLDTYGEIQATNDPKPALKIGKGVLAIDVFQLSDGERSMITLVLDLARRLVLANPDLRDPLHEGRAVVLIDEIDLHLHPGWQRIVCKRLETTFPNCQFIATTHSPQIVGEVPSSNITLIEDGRAMRPRQSLGMDTNWILQYLMNVPERSSHTQQMLEMIETLIEVENYDRALERIAEVRQTFGDFPELAALQAQIEMIDFLAEDPDIDAE